MHSCLTEGELRFGLELDPANLKLRANIENFLQRVNILAWNSEAAMAYGRVRAILHRTGRRVGPVDLLIAGHAMSIGAAMVTNNKAFQHIHGLQVKDWTVSSDGPVQGH